MKAEGHGYLLGRSVLGSNFKGLNSGLLLGTNLRSKFSWEYNAHAFIVFRALDTFLSLLICLKLRSGLSSNLRSNCNS